MEESVPSRPASPPNEREARAGDACDDDPARLVLTQGARRSAETAIAKSNEGRAAGRKADGIGREAPGSLSMGKPAGMGRLLRSLGTDAGLRRSRHHYEDESQMNTSRTWVLRSVPYAGLDAGGVRRVAAWPLPTIASSAPRSSRTSWPAHHASRHSAPSPVAA